MVRNSNNKNVFSNLSRYDCLWRYSDRFGQHSNLIIIVDDFDGSNSSSLLEYHYTGSGLGNPQARIDQRKWICANDTMGIAPDCERRKEFTSTESDWDKFGHSVRYCLAQRIEASTGYGQCQMKFSPPLALGKDLRKFQVFVLTRVVVACICMLFKVTCMWCVYFSKELRHGVTLCTLGDAIASFLEREDQYTGNLVNVTWKELSKQKGKSWETVKARAWQDSGKPPVRWARTTGRTRLYTTFSM